MESAERAMLMSDMGKIHGALGRIEAKQEEFCERLEKVEEAMEAIDRDELARARAKLRELEEEKAAISVRHIEHAQITSREKARDRRDLLKNVLLMVLGAAIMFGINMAAHALGLPPPPPKP